MAAFKDEQKPTPKGHPHDFTAETPSRFDTGVVYLLVYVHLKGHFVSSQ